MQKVITILALMLFGPAMALADDAMGSLRGVVNYCGKGGVEGMQIYLPGHQFMIIISADGGFIFDRLPIGEYAIGAMLGGQVLYKHDAVAVKAGETTDLGQLDFCVDGLNVQNAAPTPALQALHKDPQNPDMCAKNWADCDKEPSNGCETNLQKDQWNCGACGNQCSTWEYCALGDCQ